MRVRSRRHRASRAATRVRRSGASSSPSLPPRLSRAEAAPSGGAALFKGPGATIQCGPGKRQENEEIDLGVRRGCRGSGRRRPLASATPRSGTLEGGQGVLELHGRAGFVLHVLFLERRLGPGRHEYPLSPAESNSSDAILDPPGPGNNKAFGYCNLPDGLNGVCTFTGGTGKFTHFRATITVSYLGELNYHWEGPYSFSPQVTQRQPLRPALRRWPVVQEGPPRAGLPAPVAREHPCRSGRTNPAAHSETSSYAGVA